MVQVYLMTTDQKEVSMMDARAPPSKNQLWQQRSFHPRGEEAELGGLQRLLWTLTTFP